MRDQGRLVEWFDDQGYGFIQPNDSDKAKVFIHIKDFATRGPRPLVGCALDYQVILDEQGRYRAKQVKYLKAKDAKIKIKPKSNPASSNQKLKLMAILGAVYIVTIALLRFFEYLPLGVLPFILLMNALSYWLYAQDKEAAQLGNRRVPENTLHLVSFLGGWPAAWLAQQKLRHKTQKQPFRQIYFCTIGFNIILILWLISPLNSMNI